MKIIELEESELNEDYEAGFTDGYLMGTDVQRRHHTELIKELLNELRWKGTDS